MTREQLLADVEQFLADTGLSATTLGIRIAKDPNLIFDLRAGRDPTLSMANRIWRFMADNRPLARASAA